MQDNETTRMRIFENAREPLMYARARKRCVSKAPGEFTSPVARYARVTRIDLSSLDVSCC